jgi:hypothetical protein
MNLKKYFFYEIYQPTLASLKKVSFKTLLHSFFVGIFAFLAIGLVASGLCRALSGQATTTFETKKSKGVVKQNERSVQMERAAGLAFGTMGGLLSMIAFNAYLSKKKKTPMGWARAAF